jgi:pimeloyl-ACP methyl ester carboxylesterase
MKDKRGMKAAKIFQQARRLGAAFALLLWAGCARLRPTPVPLRTLDLTLRGHHPTLVVFLPGRRDSPEDFRRYGFAELAQRQGLDADFVAVDAHPGYYFNKTIVTRLREDVLGPARKTYRRILVVGISIGGTGALLYAAEHPEDVDGIILLAPYLGSDAVIDEIDRAGGPLRWQPPPPDGSDDFERRMWSFVRSNQAAATALPGAETRSIPLYLGWGESDRFARANALLGSALPAERAFHAPGGHEWKAWTVLWREALGRYTP